MTLPRGYKEAYKRWRQLCNQIQNLSVVNEAESKKEQLQRIERARKDYAFFVSYYFPHYCQSEISGQVIPSAKFHIDAANVILNNKRLKAVFKWARGHAKSTHMNIFIPLWLKCQKNKEISTMVLVGKSQDNANKLLGDLQAELQYNKRYIHDFGEQYNAGTWAEGNFITIDGCAFFALGRGQSPRGLRNKNNRPDYIIIDDLDDDELVKNEKRVSSLTKWVTSALYGTFGAEGGRFIMVGNLISRNSVLANICNISNVHVSQVNILDKNGEPSWKEYWSHDKIKEDTQFMGYREFQKEYMNNPITEGAVFKNEWIRWKAPLPLRKYERIVAYCDPSFKASTKNDYKAIKVWGKYKEELHHLYAFVRQCSVTEMVRWFYDLHERFPKDIICDYYIEANFLQDIILDEFTTEGKIRGYQLPIRPDSRKKPDKYQRIEAISPLWERGFTFYNEKLKNDPDMQAGLEQTLSFEKGTSTHDDAPDADEGAIWMLQKYTRQETYKPSFGLRRQNNIW